ncbi:MAG TPA: hypothetical protein VFZ48_02465 [Candidatus Saccharimonadales bacterium]
MRIAAIRAWTGKRSRVGPPLLAMVAAADLRVDRLLEVVGTFAIRQCPVPAAF